MIGLGLSVPGDVKAEVIVIKSFEELDKIGFGVKGKIVLFNQGWTNYDEGVDYRNDGPSAVSKYGALALIIRSVASFSINNPHTGALSYDSRYPSIPAAAISIEDAEMLQRM